MRLVIAFLMIAMVSAAASADEFADVYKGYQSDKDNTADKLDTMKACFINGSAYSAGMVAIINGRSFKCLHALNSFGDRTSGKLEWVEEGK